MIRITSVSLPIGFTDKTVRKAVCKKLRIDESQISGASLYRCSIDARKKDNIHYTATIDVKLSVGENTILKRYGSSSIFKAEPYKYQLPESRRKLIKDRLLSGAVLREFLRLLFSLRQAKNLYLSSVAEM